MARHRDARSPPPGAVYPSKRPRRDDDRSERDRRDAPRPVRRRSRSPSPERWPRERDPPRRRERSIERRHDRRLEDSYRPLRRDRSIDRRRSWDRDAVEDRSIDHRRRRSRGREHRDRRDDSRDRARKRREDSVGSRKPSQRDDSRDRKSKKVDENKDNTGPKSTPSTTHTEEDKKTERLAKLEAWKRKQAEERERKQREREGASGTRHLLEEIDKRAAGASTIPAALSVPSMPSPSSVSSTPADEEDTSTTMTTTTTTTYVGKFDPKAIVKKAAAGSIGTTTLGKDVSVPELSKASATLIPSGTGLKADHSATVGPVGSAGSASALPELRGNLSGFGLGSKSIVDVEKVPSRRGLELGEEESARKKLERLPTPPLDDTDGKANEVTTHGAEDDDDETMEDVGTEEEAAAVARAAAEKREERLQSQSQNQDQSQNQHQDHIQHLTQLPAGEPMDIDGSNVAEVNGHVTTIEQEARTDGAAPTEVEEKGKEAQDGEEVDPLDAFMSGLSNPADVEQGPSAQTTSHHRRVLLLQQQQQQQQPETIFGDDEVDLKTIDSHPGDILALAASKARKKKDLPAVNHSKMKYGAFRKTFYTEPTELATMTDGEVADLRLELDGIKIRGVDVPKPVQKWSQCGLGAQSLDVIHKLNYDRPTSIQAQAIPAIMSGRDVIGVAKTGSGKTIAFLLPMFRHIKDQPPLENMDGPVGLIMTPTRELATQIHKECKPFLKALNLRAVCAYGGAPIKDQIADLKRGAEIIVCTPGRMIDLLAANSGRVTNLRRVTYIVLDEADRMFDMGFEPQVMKIVGNIRPDKQTVLFSATFPRSMEALARKTLQRPIEIIVGGRSVVAPEITQLVEVRPDESKFLRLLELLGELYDADEDARTLIFVDRQESADGLLRDLMRKGYPCMSIHGGKDQVDRNSTIDDFKAGVVPIMIATSVAARGLDVKQLKLVVNYDAPNHLEDYVHRAGRTGRAGNTGTAVTFLTVEQERYSVDIAKALRQSGQLVPEEVQKMVDSFTEKVKAGKEKASGSGFGGKGLERLDQERDATRNRERKTYKTGEEGEEDEKDEKKGGKTNADDIVAKAASAVRAAAPVPSSSSPSSLPGVPKGIDLDGKITVHRTEVAPSAASGSKNALDRVGQAVADINSRLNKTGHLRSGVPTDNKGPDAGAFHATLEINDFPQKARWAVTNRTNVAKILEATGTSITTKGSFYPAGKEPQAGENPKLYILVEGDTEVVVTNAMRELMRLLKEGTTAAMDSEARAPASGRYNVV